MSWLFSRALVAEYLAEKFLDGEQSAPSNGSLTPQAYCAPDRMTVFSRLFRFGMTFKPLTANRGEALLMLYLEDFPAKTSALPEKELESTESGLECGDTWHGLLARFDPDSSSWKTAQLSLLGDSDESSVTWPRSGMTVGGQCWELPMLGRRIKGTDFGLWQTPVADDAVERVIGKWNSRGEPKLSAQVKMWPTPTSTLGTHGGLVTPTKAREGGTLIESLSARTKWPTPKANDAEKRGNFDATNKRNGLPAAVKLWPTPTANCGTGPGHQGREGGLNLQTAVYQTPVARMWKDNGRSPSELERNSPTLATQAGGQLNPTWVEWPTAWPLGWTDLKPLETDKSPCAPQRHGGF